MDVINLETFFVWSTYTLGSDFIYLILDTRVAIWQVVSFIYVTVLVHGWSRIEYPGGTQKNSTIGTKQPKYPSDMYFQARSYFLCFLLGTSKKLLCLAAVGVILDPSPKMLNKGETILARRPFSLIFGYLTLDQRKPLHSASLLYVAGNSMPAGHSVVIKWHFGQWVYEWVSS